jgi:hypothetical protein
MKWKISSAYPGVNSNKTPSALINAGSWGLFLKVAIPLLAGLIGRPLGFVHRLQAGREGVHFSGGYPLGLSCD